MADLESATEKTSSTIKSLWKKRKLFPFIVIIALFLAIVVMGFFLTINL